MRLSVASFASIVGASPMHSDAVITGLCLDSRRIETGDLFVALSGSRVDGHDYLEHALEQGAVAALVERAPSQPGPWIVVPDCVEALARWAKQHRSSWPGQLCALTGSVGKSTTRAMIQAILEHHYGADAVCATVGNLNNHLGVPLTLSHLSSKHRVAVMELGASGMGEIAALTDMTQPQVGLITCVAPCHVEGFGSVDAIAQGKGELFDRMKPSGHIIVPLDDEYAPFWLQRHAEKTCTTFGHHHKADVRILSYEQAEQYVHVQALYHQTPFTFKVPGTGAHLVDNALAAIAASVAMGVPLEETAKGVAQFKAVAKRLSIRQSWLKGVVVLDDAYNANPRSFKAALHVLLKHPGKKVIAMGGMEELGADSALYHQQLADLFLASDVEHVFCVGKTAYPCYQRLGDRGSFFEDHATLLEALKQCLNPGSMVLVKGSFYKWRMDKIVQALCDKEFGL